ncbi:hypothetical protein FGO68_gene5271 [Halteria grandinella]|uniref:Uncharacterized protein n=1 Tax=Halteria grandinella TaxID=5974 RepID=A0A8J8T9T6_HALGN|nr:hypothetical protein FGO68_gene5271 [Halteria grandinella]
MLPHTTSNQHHDEPSRMTSHENILNKSQMGTIRGLKGDANASHSKTISVVFGNQQVSHAVLNTQSASLPLVQGRYVHDHPTYTETKKGKRVFTENLLVSQLANEKEGQGDLADRAGVASLTEAKRTNWKKALSGLSGYANPVNKARRHKRISGRRRKRWRPRESILLNKIDTTLGRSRFDTKVNAFFMMAPGQYILGKRGLVFDQFCPRPRIIQQVYLRDE